MIDTDAFLRLIDGVKRGGSGWMGRCPAHEDRLPSLSIKRGDDGRTLFHCHAGCSPESILAALRLKWDDISPAGTWTKDATAPVDFYDYRDEDGKLLYQVVRYAPKDFKQRRPIDGGGWAWNLQGVKRVPYRLPELLAAKKGLVFFVVEGEKDADLLSALGYVATTNAGGAGKWMQDFGRYFKGRQAILLPDNDTPGLDHMKAVEKNLIQHGATEVHILKLPDLPPKGDVSDWFRLTESTKEVFDSCIYETLREAELDRQATEESTSIDEAEAKAKEWWNLSDLVTTTAIREPEGYLHGEIFCRGRISMIFGKGGSGKSYFAMFLGSQIALGQQVHGMPTRPGRILLLSEEMGGPDVRFRTRLVFDDETIARLSPRQFGVKWHTGLDFFGDRGRTLKDNKSVIEFVRVCERANKPDVVFIDSLSRIHHAKENDNSEMGVVCANLEMAARLAGVAIIFIHHSKKSDEFSTGSEKARGATIIRDYCQDVLQVECVSQADKYSVITFEKTQSLAGGKVATPFGFTQEIDPTGRMVKKSTGEMVAAVKFVTGDYKEGETPAVRKKTDAARKIVEQLENLIDVKDDRVVDGKMRRQDVLAAIKQGQVWTDKQAKDRLQFAIARGFLGHEKRGDAKTSEVWVWPTMKEN